MVIAHINSFFIDGCKHLDFGLRSLQLVDEMVGMVFFLLLCCLVDILELHLPNESLLVHEVDGDVIEGLNLLLDCDDFNSREVFE